MMEASEEQIELEAPGAAQEPVTDDPVCAYLLEHSRLKAADLRRAQTYQEQHGGDLVTLLVRLGLVSERDVAEAEAGLLPDSVLVGVDERTGLIDDGDGAWRVCGQGAVTLYRRGQPIVYNGGQVFRIEK